MKAGSAAGLNGEAKILAVIPREGVESEHDFPEDHFDVIIAVM